jgi:hypothetical protein
MRRTDREVPEWLFASRRTYWWEWLLILLLLGMAGGVRAAPVYKCVGVDGSIAYQQWPCAGAQRESAVELAPPPAYARSPEYAVEREPPPRARATAARRGAAAEPTSFECRAADGQLFYRHSACPHSVAAVALPASSSRSTRGARGNAAASVSSRRIPRDEACREIHAAGAIGRAGHEHDENVSTYERNLGRDPCR